MHVVGTEPAAPTALGPSLCTLLFPRRVHTIRIGRRWTSGGRTVEHLLDVRVVSIRGVFLYERRKVGGEIRQACGVTFSRRGARVGIAGTCGKPLLRSLRLVVGLDH